MRHSSGFIRKGRKLRQKRIDRLSIQNIEVKLRVKEAYMCGIYLSILNCGYINDRIVLSFCIGLNPNPGTTIYERK